MAHFIFIQWNVTESVTEKHCDIECDRDSVTNCDTESMAERHFDTESVIERVP